MCFFDCGTYSIPVYRSEVQKGAERLVQGLSWSAISKGRLYPRKYFQFSLSEEHPVAKNALFFFSFSKERAEKFFKVEACEHFPQCIKSVGVGCSKRAPIFSASRLFMAEAGGGTMRTEFQSLIIILLQYHNGYYLAHDESD